MVRAVRVPRVQAGEGVTDRRRKTRWCSDHRKRSEVTEKNREETFRLLGHTCTQPFSTEQFISSRYLLRKGAKGAEVTEFE